MAADENIDATNFRKYAKAAVKRYEEKNMLVDALFWSHIIRLYERELTAKPGVKP